MPDTLDIDMTDIDIGQYIKISDLSYDNLEILIPGRVMVVGVVSSRVAARSLIEAEEEAAAAAAAKAAEEAVKEGVKEGKEVKEAKEEKAEEAPAHAEKTPAGETRHSEGGPKKEH